MVVLAFIITVGPTAKKNKTGGRGRTIKTAQILASTSYAVSGQTNMITDHGFGEQSVTQGQPLTQVNCEVHIWGVADTD